jgi:hypothetical protein
MTTYGSDAPIPYEWSATPEIEQEQSAETVQSKPVPVEIVNTVSKNLAPDSTAWNTFPIPQAPNSVQICPHRYQRYKAKFNVTIAANTTLLLAKTQDALSTGSSVLWSMTSTSVPGTIPDYDGMQALYAAFTGTGPVTIAVMDEGFKPVQ